jgi:MFS transporter, ACS family, solute carrier family 17 (sodium-dependent inorganic phosphate cotransporter), other
MSATEILSSSLLAVDDEKDASLSPRRMLVVTHMFAALTICAIDRSCLSVLILPMSSEFGWSESRQGVVMAALFCGYLTTGVVAGRAADRVGGRRVLAAGVMVWSLMTLATPIAARQGFPALLVARFLLGCGEGSAMPAMNAIVKAWVPDCFISRALAFIYSGMYVGSVLGLVLTPPLMKFGSGWPAVFYAFGLCGLAWSLLFIATVTESDGSPSVAGVPTHETRSGFRTRAYHLAAPAGGSGGEAGLADEDEAVLPTLVELLRERAVVAILIAHLCATNGFFIMVVWLPSYLVLRFGVGVSNSAVLSVAPFVTMFVVSNVSGVLADFAIRRGRDRTWVRKAMQSVGFVGPSVFLALLMTAKTEYVAVCLVTIGLGLSSFSQAGVYCNHQDIAGSAKVAGVLLGMSNTVASLPGIFGVSLTGFIIDRTNGNWNIVFGLTIGVYVVGLLFYCAFGSAEQMF